MFARRLRMFAPALAVLVMLLAGLSMVTRGGAQEAPAVIAAPAADVSTAFTYQGYLEDVGAPANGSFDFEFALYDALSGCCQVGETVTANDVMAQNGVFTVQLDFSAPAFDGGARWLEICVAPAGGSCNTLSPRQPLSATPYALSLRPGALIAGDPPADSGVLNLTSSQHGLLVSEAGLDGVRIQSAGENGVDVAGDALAGYFAGHVEITGGCTGCILSTFAVNAGETALRPGDVVSLLGLQPSEVDAVPMLMEVGPAQAGAPPVGIVKGGAELVPVELPRPGESDVRLVPAKSESVPPGAYLTIVYAGMVQVRASALDGAIAQGDRLTVSETGSARAMRSVELDGISLAENAPVLGVALESLGAGEGLIWVLAGLQ